MSKDVLVLRRKVKTQDRTGPIIEGCETLRELGPVIEHDIIIEIDVGMIALRMGDKAVRNKTGKSRDGFVTVRRAKN